MPELDRKANNALAGKVVRKDLVHQVRVGVNVPTYVLEYLLGKYCATDDPVAVEAGLRLVHSTLIDNIIRPDEAMKAQSYVKERGQQQYIDKVLVRLDGTKYWAELVNFGHRFLHIPDQFVRRYERLLEGGVWAQVEIEFRAEEDDDKARPFYITDLRPIQIASFDIDEYCSSREQFTRDEWLDLVVRSIGFEPSMFTRRIKMLMLMRLIPMVERNFNLIELGPRGTGKSFVYRDLSPYAILISGGKTTVANLFYNLSTRKIGLVGMWDVVAFDEVAGIQFSDATGIQILKDYMESGSFSRGREELIAEASIVFNGNINQPIDILTRTGTLFQPLPEDMQDMALIDRLHFYLPGWEMPKMRNEFFTSHYGLVVDYLAEALRELRKRSYTHLVDSYFLLGTDLNTRDVRAVKRAVSGLTKLLHPSGNATKDEVREYLELALEGRRRVKEQLKKMGAFEYYQTAFSYIDTDTMEETFVGVPEGGGHHLISSEEMPPGTVYAGDMTDSDIVALCRLEVSHSPGSGKLRLSGAANRATKESINAAFDYVKANKAQLGFEHELDIFDYHVQVVDLLNSREGLRLGVAFLVALYSALKNLPAQPSMAIVGDVTVMGLISPVRSLIDPLQMMMDNGAKRALLPLTSRRLVLEAPPDLIEHVDPVFYSDPISAVVKAVGLK